MAYTIQLSSHRNETLQHVIGLANLDESRIVFQNGRPKRVHGSKYVKTVDLL
jgi:hypothetical protein